MDTYIRRGMHAGPFGQAPPLSFGVDGAGVVTAAGDQAIAKAGDRVAWVGVLGKLCGHGGGTERCPCAGPRESELRGGRGRLMQGLTAQYLSHVGVPVPKDAVVLVHSAGSGVGRMLTQLATHRGGRVIATVSRAHKAAAAREAGAWQVLVRDETEDLGAAIRELAGGNGVDIVFDGTGKTLFGVSVSVLRVGGTFATYGYAGGPIPPISLGGPAARGAPGARPANGPELTAGPVAPARAAGDGVDQGRHPGRPDRPHLPPRRRRLRATATSNPRTPSASSCSSPDRPLPQGLRRAGSGRLDGPLTQAGLHIPKAQVCSRYLLTWAFPVERMTEPTSTNHPARPSRSC